MPDNRSILYLGDTTLNTAAAYLAGVMTHWGFDYDYLPSKEPLTVEHLAPGKVGPRRLFILSDYAADRVSEAVQQKVLEQVAGGAGLLMIGGWGSFHGQDGRWGGAPIARALPVQIESADDRINCDQPALIASRIDHPITAALPWDTRPPTIGGFNRFTPKDDATLVLDVHRFAARCENGQFTFEERDRYPLLVVGRHQQGRTAALATDVAPHWVGGLVDWGEGRVTATAPGSHEIEVGDLYAAFLRNLLKWAGNL